VFIPILLLILFGASWFFFVLAVDPKSKYAFIGAVFAVVGVCIIVWPYLDRMDFGPRSASYEERGRYR
jgi:membrane associated rhomboid family serine protease